ncbi:MAG: hypothetical protein AB1730_27330 [Myxococcota bacterium]
MRSLALGLLVSLAACGRTALVDDELLLSGLDAGGGGAEDASLPGDDAGVRDAGSPDAGVPDAGPPDAGRPDAGAPDAGGVDAGAPDAGLRRCEGRVSMGFEVDFLDLERLVVRTGVGPMGLPPPPADLKIAYSANQVPHAIVQNVNGAAIAIVANRTLATLTAADVANATFTFVTPTTPFDATHVVLITTPVLNTFALGNPAESTNLSFDVRLVRGQCP